MTKPYTVLQALNVLLAHLRRNYRVADEWKHHVVASNGARCLAIKRMPNGQYASSVHGMYEATGGCRLVSALRELGKDGMLQFLEFSILSEGGKLR